MSAKSLKWRLPKRRRPSETIEGKKKERRNRGMARSAEFIHFRLGADTGDPAKAWSKIEQSDSSAFGYDTYQSTCLEKQEQGNYRAPNCECHCRITPQRNKVCPRNGLPPRH